jgi:uncharacterized hydrophobic protein (TIGR00271 family)
MLQLRLISPPACTDDVVRLLVADTGVVSVELRRGAAVKPADGDVIVADVLHENANELIDRIRALDVDQLGELSLIEIEATRSEPAHRASLSARGRASDVIVWTLLEARVHPDGVPSIAFFCFMACAALIATVGIVVDSAILIVGAMVVGPEFGPLAGLSVALVERRREFARRSLMALGVGFPVGIVLACLATLVFKSTGIAPDDFVPGDHELTGFISHPDFFSFSVAFMAGVVGMLSLTNAKSGALVGVLISVTTIPAASNIGVAAAYGDWGEAGGAAAQLAINLTSIVLAGVLTLFVQRRYYIARRRKHLRDPSRAAAGLPVGRSARRAKGG